MFNTCIQRLRPALVLALLMTCGGDHDPPAKTPPTPKSGTPIPGAGHAPLAQQRFRFTLAPCGPVPGLRGLTLTLRAMALRGEDLVWHPLPLPASDGRVDLLAAPAPLTQGAWLPRQSYTHARLDFGAEANLVLGSGAQLPLRLPSERRVTLPLEPAITSHSAGTREHWLLLDLAAALEHRVDGTAFRPERLHSRDQANTGAVRGTLLDRRTGTALAGVLVTAQPAAGPDATGAPLRTAVTGATGQFHLDLLPEGPVLLIAQPLDGDFQTATRIVKVDPGLDPGPEVTLQADPGARVRVSRPLPASESGLRVDLICLPEGAAPYLLRQTVTAPETRAADFDQVPVGRYRLRLRNLDGTGSASESEPFSVSG